MTTRSSGDQDEGGVRLSRSGAVATLTLQRPERRNALDDALIATLRADIRALGEDPSVGLLVLTGDGPTFCSGIDLDAPYFTEDADVTEPYRDKRLLDHQQLLISEIFEFPAFTVAALNGDAVGGAGLGLAMACDLRLAVRSARFRTVTTRLDVVQDFGLLWLLQRLVGPSRALQIVLMGTAIDAEKAEEWALVNELCDDVTALRQRIADLSNTLASGTSDVLRMHKLVHRNASGAPLGTQLGLESIANALAFAGPGFRAGREALLREVRGSSS
jgi:enoyl-CoA hydratase/carnithine racemase